MNALSYPVSVLKMKLLLQIPMVFGEVFDRSFHSRIIAYNVTNDKFKFKFIRGDKNDSILNKTAPPPHPRSTMNFRHSAVAL